MSVYSVKGKGYRYDFTLKGIRHSGAWYPKRQDAKQAEAKRREELLNPKQDSTAEATPTGIVFLDLLNMRLDYVRAYNCERHYTDHLYLAKRWVKLWGQMPCRDITPVMIQNYLLKRQKAVSSYTANKELRYLRAVFYFGMHPTRNWLSSNPTRGIQFFPLDKQIKYVPPKEDVLKVILAADSETQDYLWTVALTMGRMSEINRLSWQEVSLEGRYVILYTRKKRGGHRTPRKVPMSGKLFEVLARRHKSRDKNVPWVFWHRYQSSKNGEWAVGPYKERKHIMASLCKKAGVRYFRYHALRHFGASLLEQANVPIGSIQRILGHESRTTTEIYLHSIGDSERRAVEILDENFDEFSHTESHTEKKGLQP
jgi:integrase